MTQQRSPEWDDSLLHLNSRILPAAILLLCYGFFSQLYIYVEPIKFFTFLMICGFSFALLLLRIISRNQMVWTERLSSPSWVVIPGSLACLLIIFLLPSPYDYGAFILALGWVLQTGTGKLTLRSYFAGALFQTGLILMIIAGLMPLMIGWSARYHDFSWSGQHLTTVVSGLLNQFGYGTEVVGDAIKIGKFEDVTVQKIVVEKLLPIPLLLFGLIWSVVVYVKSEVHRFERILTFLLMFFAYAILRYTLLVMLLLQRGDPNYFWRAVPMLLSLLPLIFLVREPNDLSTIRERRSIGSRQVGIAGGRGLVLGFLFGISAITGFTFHDPGTSKRGHVLINEHGSDWEWTTEAMDTVTFNEKTTYNYYCLAEYLKYYYSVTTNFNAITQETLQNIDVLIIKMPTQPYQTSELDAITDFVEKGGGVWVIGDHTNVFGSSNFLNPLLARFGCRLGYNSTHDLATGKLSLYEKPPIFAHPTVLNLPPYLFATSCTVAAPMTAEGAIIGYGLRADHLDYSQKNFFSDRTRKQNNFGFGLFLQQAAIKHGKGRLLIYTDSTTFSNFFVFIKGKPELILGSLNWLNRVNWLSWLNALMVIVAMIAVLVIILTRNLNGAVLAGILFGVSLGGSMVEEITKSAYLLPSPKNEVPYLNFEREHSEYFLPTLRLAEEGDDSYLTFFIWTQRLGAVPREVNSFSETISGSHPIILINPSKMLGKGQLDSLKLFIRGGGKLLVLNSADNDSELTALIAREFGLEMHTRPIDQDSLRTLTLGGRVFPLKVKGAFSWISGGEVFLVSDQGDPIGSGVIYGDGRVLFVSCGHLFRNKAMGETTIVPDEGLRALYRIEFDIVKQLMD